MPANMIFQFEKQLKFLKFTGHKKNSSIQTVHVSGQRRCSELIAFIRQKVKSGV